MNQIEKILTISTSHLSESDISKLREENKISLCDFEYGIFLFVSAIQSDKKYSTTFYNIVDLARKNECAYILFDRDVKENNQLPIYNWG